MADDPDPHRCAGVAGDGTHRYAGGFPGLSLQVQEVLKRDPMSGHLFVFRGRKGNLLEVIWHDGQGACLFTKRLEKGRFLWPTRLMAQYRSRRLNSVICSPGSIGDIPRKPGVQRRLAEGLSLKAPANYDSLTG